MYTFIFMQFIAAAYPLEMLILKKKKKNWLTISCCRRLHSSAFAAVQRLSAVESSRMPPNWLVATFGYSGAYFYNATQRHPPTSTNNGKLFIKCLLPHSNVTVLLAISVWQVIWHARFYDVVTLLLT